MAKEENNIQFYNEKDFRERVSSSVQSNIGMLIPEDEFDNLVQNEIKAFFEEDIETILFKEDMGYSNKDKLIQQVKITPFRKMIWDEVEKQMTDKVKENFQASEVANAVSSFYESGTMQQKFEWNDFVSKLAKEIAPQMAEKMFERIIAEAVSVSSNEVMSRLNR